MHVVDISNLYAQLLAYRDMLELLEGEKEVAFSLTAIIPPNEEELIDACSEDCYDDEDDEDYPGTAVRILVTEDETQATVLKEAMIPYLKERIAFIEAACADHNLDCNQKDNDEDDDTPAPTKDSKVVNLRKTKH